MTDTPSAPSPFLRLYLAELDGVVDRLEERNELGASEDTVAGDDDLEEWREEGRQGSR